MAKFKIQFKDPDGVSESILEAARRGISENLEQDEREAIEERRVEKLNESITPWVKYGEYITIEIDTESKTATVCTAK